MRTHKLTVGMATYDDFDGVYFTVQALRMYHTDVPDIDIVVINNDVGGKADKALATLSQLCRIIDYDHSHSTAVKDLVFREARGEYVLCIDCHVLLEPGALRSFVDYLDKNVECMDLIQGPLVADNFRSASTHFRELWSEGYFGQWAIKQGITPTSPAFEIGMQGCGLIGCRREAWLGYPPRWVGFGGEEGYLQEAYRQAGRRALCLPSLRWIHRFGRPHGQRYEMHWEDRIRNYVLGRIELGQPYDDIADHFAQYLGATGRRIIAEIEEEASRLLFMFEVAYCIAGPGDMDQWKRIGIYRLRRAKCHSDALFHIMRAKIQTAIVFDAPPPADWTPENHRTELLDPEWRALQIISGRDLIATCYRRCR